MRVCMYVLFWNAILSNDLHLLCYAVFILLTQNEGNMNEATTTTAEKEEDYDWEHRLGTHFVGFEKSVWQAASKA